MSTTLSPATLSPSSARRPWYRLHLSTWLFLLAAAGVLGYYNFSVFERDVIDSRATDIIRAEQGWPCVWQRTCSLAELHSYSPSYMPPLDELRSRFWPAAVLANAGTAALILVGIGVVLERRLRFGRRVWQLTLREVFLAVTVFAVMFAGMRSKYLLWKQQTAAIAVMSQHACVFAFADDQLLPAYPRSAIGDLLYGLEDEHFHVRNYGVLRYVGPTQVIRRMHLLDCAYLSSQKRKHFSDCDTTALVNFPDLARLDIQEAASDVTLQTIGKLRSVTHLSLNHVSHAESLSHLGNLAKLRWLRFTTVSDVELANLAPIPSLRSLELSDDQLSDDCLATVTQFSGLQELTLSRTSVSDAGLAALAKLKHLKVLNLNYTKITDAGLAQLIALKQLESLHLNGTKITDLGLEHVAQFPQLKSVQLERTQITDDGLNTLQTMTKLEEARVLPLKVSEPGFQRLREHLALKRARQ